MKLAKIGNDLGGRKWRVCAAVSMMMGVSACTDLQFSDKQFERLTVKVQDAVTFNQCTPPTTPNPGAKIIQIEFVNIEPDPAEPAIWCPERAVETCPITYRNNNVRWSAVKLDTTTGDWEVITEANFNVYFSPFANGSVDSIPNQGITTPMQVLGQVPEAVYKYTVVPETVSEDCEVLDPNFWVNN